MSVLVSIHSRPKAAARSLAQTITPLKFQYTAARRRLEAVKEAGMLGNVSIHSRPKAAEHIMQILTAIMRGNVSIHSRPKAAGDSLKQRYLSWKVSTHSRPKAAGHEPVAAFIHLEVSTHSRPKAAGHINVHHGWDVLFQHTAARRRLEYKTGASLAITGFQHTAA